jgi:hypothetical protein
MKKLRHGRKAVSTIIGGIIILTLILTALTSIIFIVQQYDAYETIINLMSQKDIDRSAEEVLTTYPGIMGPQLVDTSGQVITSCGVGPCYNRYNITLSNSGGVGIQIVRIYINSTSTCDNLCIFKGNNSTSSQPVSYTFDSSASFINPAETGHILAFWLSNTMNLPQDSVKANTVSLATSRGRVFTFEWPFPPAGDYVPTDLHLDTGPIRIIYDPNLITFTMNGTQPYKTPGPSGCANTYPSTTPCLQDGWTVPIPIDPEGIVFYLRLSNIAYPGNVIILDKSYILARGWNTVVPNSLSWFYVIQPMPAVCQSTYFASSYLDSTWPTSGSSSCPTPYGSTFQSYNLTGTACVQSGIPCYRLPPGPSLGFSGKSVYVLFSATAPHQNPKPTAQLLLPTANYALFLQLYYLYNGYEYSSTIPLISVVTS